LRIAGDYALDSGELCRRHAGRLLHLPKLFHLTAVIRRSCRHSSPSPPCVASVDLAPAAWSSSARSRWGFCPTLGACGGVSTVSAGWMAFATPASSRGAVLCLAAWPWFLCCSAVAIAHWMVAFRRHNRGCADGVAAMIFLQLPCELTCESFSYSLCLCIHALVAWPVSQACLPTAAVSCLILCLDPALPMLASVCCYC
jgi:hypothetical protein